MGGRNALFCDDTHQRRKECIIERLWHLHLHKWVLETWRGAGIFLGGCWLKLLNFFFLLSQDIPRLRRENGGIDSKERMSSFSGIVVIPLNLRINN